ncbi:helix-turn-helix domain-containing protein [Shewanella saliphila]|nr:XRE family transcriptional regulator [Shewanella saliphila]MCL1103344.1 XRE family transcriptional regulator [Shewanella saliphila]
MNTHFNPSRLKLARTRRQLTLKSLAESVGLTPRMVSEYEKERCTSQPKDATIDAFSKALNYPAEFFFSDDVDEVENNAISFRSLKSMKASQQHAAVGAGAIGVMLNSYFSDRFNPVDINIPNLTGSDPELAASIIRTEWNLGSQSVGDMINLLEKHGVRVFSLDENTLSVDAFSFWKDGTPYVFLNTKKSGERSRFDAAHELGHLILHRDEIPQGKEIEREADRFAAFLLMPRDTVLPYSGKFLTIDNILKLKKNWKVSAMALIFHMKNLGVITEWQYRTLIIDASKLGLRTNEIDGIPRETSKLIKQLLAALQARGVSVRTISNELNLPIDEVTGLLFMLGVVSNPKKAKEHVLRTKPSLTLV